MRRMDFTTYVEDHVYRRCKRCKATITGLDWLNQVEL